VLLLRGWAKSQKVQTVEMRIGCLQFAPQVGDVNNNLNRADSVLSKANPDDLDILVLPELAFSGNG
jgi:protein N-terminal amidase